MYILGLRQLKKIVSGNFTLGSLYLALLTSGLIHLSLATCDPEIEAYKERRCLAIPFGLDEQCPVLGWKLSPKGKCLTYRLQHPGLPPGVVSYFGRIQ